MNEFSEDAEHQRLLQQRINQLRNQLDEISGGAMQFGGTDEAMNPEEEIAFLEHVIAVETAPDISWKTKFSGQGYTMPLPASMDDETVSLELWEVIQRLAEQHAYLDSTDHLSDRELYELLFDDLLNEEHMDMPFNEDSAWHISLCSSGSDEDTEKWLRYYADEKTRQEWVKDFPDCVLPPHEDPPYDRDRLLPQRREPTHPVLAYAYRLLGADWEEQTGPMRLNPDLSLDEVSGSFFFSTAQILLKTLSEIGPVKATAKNGNLPRSFVSAVYPLLPFTAKEREDYDYYSKTLDEEKLGPLIQARIACQKSGLLRKSRGQFVVTRKGRAMLAPEKAGVLYKLLFLGLFRKTNLAAFDGAPELPCIQQTLPVILWRFYEGAQEWAEWATFEEQALLPEVYDEVLAARHAWSTPGSTIHIRVWHHLHAFGLLEFHPEAPGPGDYPEAIRITPLGRKFFMFDPLAMA